MTNDNPAHIRQANAVSLELTFGMQALENSKQSFGIFRIEAGAIIADIDNLFAVGVKL